MAGISSPIAALTGLPQFSASSLPKASASASIRSAIRNRAADRSDGVVRDQALNLTASIAELDVEIERAAQGLDGYDSLVSIKGIGPRSAAVFLSGIGKVDDFESADKLAAYLGIVPRVSQSNETDNRGRITKQGNKLMRSTLVQCTLIAIRYSGYLNGYYRRIKDRRGTGKAIIATARKFLAIIFNTLKNKWVFEDFTKYTFVDKPLSAGQSS